MLELFADEGVEPGGQTGVSATIKHVQTVDVVIRDFIG